MSTAAWDCGSTSRSWARAPPARSSPAGSRAAFARAPSPPITRRSSSTWR